MVNFRYVTENPDEASAHLAERYTRFRIQATDRRFFAFEDTVAGDEKFTVERLTFRARGTATTDVTPSYVVAHLLAGRWSATSRRHALDVRQPVLYPHGETESAWHDLRLGIVTISAEEVLEAARLLGAGRGERFAFTGHNPVDEARNAIWISAVQQANRQIIGNPDGLSKRVLREEARRALVLALLHAFPNTTMDAPRSPDVGAAPEPVRRAVCYIEENAHQAVDIVDIAQASGLSVRGIQAAFRRNFDMPPLAYVRMVRLEAVRRELRALHREDPDTVASIAHRWGFAHLGRFAAQYRERFGEPPSATRNR